MQASGTTIGSGRATKDESMFTIHKQEIEWGGRTLTLETGHIARQADGAVLATYGETVVLCAVTAAKSVKEGQDFFPLTVHYQEKYSAAGRIPGGFFKRERGATEHETLTSRLIDRPLLMRLWSDAGTDDWSSAIPYRPTHLHRRAPDGPDSGACSV